MNGLKCHAALKGKNKKFHYIFPKITKLHTRSEKNFKIIEKPPDDEIKNSRNQSKLRFWYTFLIIKKKKSNVILCELIIGQNERLSHNQIMVRATVFCNCLNQLWKWCEDNITLLNVIKLLSSKRAMCVVFMSAPYNYQCSPTGNQ